jgi:hypothetical protein
MKRTLFLFLGWYLIIQAILAGLNVFSNPQNGFILTVLAILSGWGGSKLLHKVKVIDSPETQSPAKE